MFTFTTYLKKLPKQDDPVLQSILDDVHAKKLAFSPKEGWDIRRFINSVGYKKADETRKAALHAFLVHYQAYYAHEVRNGIR